MNNIFPLLAIETSDSVCGACVYYDEEKYFSSKLILKHSHAEKLFDVIKSVLDMASITQNELKIDCCIKWTWFFYRTKNWYVSS